MRLRACTALLGIVFGLVCAERAGAVSATGGAVTNYALNGTAFNVHSFTTSGTFTVAAGGNVEVLVVAGGGGGADYGGGGGAGGLIYSNAFPVTNGSYTVTVGVGGAGATGPGVTGANGSNSVFGALTAYGGGGGGSRGSPSTVGCNGANGGSGGGASPSDNTTILTYGGAATNGQGNAGGNGRSPAQASNWAGGGGGGAGAAGGNATGNNSTAAAGAGGIGLAYNLSAGTNVYYAGGGGGGNFSSGASAAAGGLGGGGAGSKNTVGTPGTANTGGGGGGGALSSSGGAGGSGIVIVRYVTPTIPSVNNSLGATGVTTSSAWLTGGLSSTGTAQTAWGLLWGTNNPGAAMSGWLGGGSTNLGAVTTPTTNAFVQVIGLQANTTYYYSYWATNAVGTNVAAPTAFTIWPQWPAISNAPASGVWGQGATINGNLASVGGDAQTTVYLYWGTNSAAWSYTNNLGISGVGPVSNKVTGLLLGVTYHYQFYASNLYGAGWAPTTNAFTTQPAPVHSLFNPGDYAVLTGNFAVANGTIAIDTKDGTIAPTWAYGTTNFTGQIVTNQGGSVVMALFNFGNLAISNAVSCTVTGNLGLVLSSTGSMTIASTIDLSGLGGTTNAGGLGGPGGEAGGAGTSFASAPPTANHGMGGYNTAGAAGCGFGGGPAMAGGGGYGGSGGYGTGAANGGTNYGDSALTVLYGGSGGGAESTYGGSEPSGGGGGGALELIANGTLTIAATATQRVNGGAACCTAFYRAAGGGSGGGMILAANNLLVYGALQAAGANGQAQNGQGTCGGGGGGGRIAFYANQMATNNMSLSVTNGAASGSSAQNGAPGTFRFLGDGLGGDLSYPFVGAVTLPAIMTAGSTNVQTRSADLAGNLLTLGGDPNTTVLGYWGTNSSAWDFRTNLGVRTLGYVTNHAAGLLPGTTYFFTYGASNAAGLGWASGTNSFNTLTLWPAIANTGVGAIMTNAVTVSGYLSSTGESATVVHVFYGTTVGGWTFDSSAPASGIGPVSVTLSNLSQNTTYYYQLAASNAAGWGYAPTTNSFATAPVLWFAAQTNSLVNPARYPVLAGSLTMTGGTLAINTGDGITVGPSMTAITGGATNTYGGLVVPSQGNNVWLSLFNFGKVSIGSNVSCTVTGSLGLVLASAGDMTIANTIDLSGQAGSLTTGGLGGPGGEAGVAGSSFASAPPGDNHGMGGYNAVGAAGCGFGGGPITAGGGGYGGVGGAGTGAANGGTNYGNSALTVLYGGSGGGANNLYAGVTPSGGGGGGALELIANGTLTVTATATQKVNGGAAYCTAFYRAAGGGSGGGMILAANKLLVYGTLQANGGNGQAQNGQGSGYGGGGGGGRIAFYANQMTTNNMNLSVKSGAASGAGAQDGAPGTFLRDPVCRGFTRRGQPSASSRASSAVLFLDLL